ncbi:MAG: efflux RND transporter permease subunit [Planctomycetaceae bacterium]|nr:efflux RND transporter permease subunit [Planctomycetaceae bacterium]
MNLPELCIRRPVMTTLMMAGLLLVGVISYRDLPVSDLPNVDFPTILVSAALPGASPETMASAVATPLEKQFTTIAGLASMSSSSQLGSTQITLQFDLSRSIDAAALDVQAAISQAGGQLPPELPNPPSFRKVNPADQPILYIALTSPTLPVWTLDEYGETLMAQRISTISGVAQVVVFGAQKYAVRIRANPSLLANINLSIDEVAQAVQEGNVTLPTGVLYGPHKAFTIEATGQLNDAAAYRPLIVAYRGGAVVRLQDVATVFDSVENDTTAAWYCTRQSQQRSVILAIQRQPGTNTVEVAGAVKKLLPTFQAQLPTSVSLHMLYDRSQAVEASANDVQVTLLLTLALVVAVIFLFLRSVAATIIPSLTLPMSIIATFAVMYLLNYSLDNLSLMALTLSVGFVVDDAIVMLENIVRHMEMGKPRLQAALEGSREIGFTIISMTISLSAVFIPVLFMGGIVGRLFREFAVTIGAAVLISGFVSLTLTPMMCSRFLRPPQSGRRGRLYAAGERAFERIVGLYGRTLRPVLAHRLITVLVSLAVLAGTFWLFVAVPKGFLPSEDRSQVFCYVQASEGISYESMFAHQQAVNDAIQQFSFVDSFMSSAGGRGGFGALNTGFIFIRLKPPSQREASADQIVQVLRRSLSDVPGVEVFPQNPPIISVGGQLTKSQYQYTIQGPDTTALYQYAQKLEARLRGRPGFQDVTSDLQIKNPQVTVQIDRDKARAYGLNARQIETTLFNAYASRQISTILAPNNQYQVILESLIPYQQYPSDLRLIYTRSSNGPLVPLSAVATLTEGVGPLTINHLGQLPSVTISFNLPPGSSLGPAVAEVQRLASDLPATMSTSFQGTAQAFQSSQSGMLLLIAVAVLVIYLVLGILYESFIHPITILTALPFAGFGALAALALTGTDLSLYAFVGIIMLVGLVKKNGIMMIDFAIEAQRREGKSPHDAIYEACLIRFRPIMMTTVAALMAGLPIALGGGIGADSRRPLGIAVVGGLIFSQTLTLYVTPVFYLLFERLRTWRRRGKQPQGTLQGKEL